MLIDPLQKKWVAQLFLCIYLLLITSTGNTFFWCMDAETNLHLESNSGGKCWTPCLSESEEHQVNEQAPNASGALSSDLGDCFDSPAYSSVTTHSTKSRTKNKVTATDVNASRPSFTPTQHLGAESGTPSLAHLLPPRQTLSALRTVVLLH